MQLHLRAGTPDDAAACGRIIFEAFGKISRQHNFPTDFPKVEIAIGLASMLLAHPKFYCAVAELDGRIAGSLFMAERSIVSAIGPLTVDPAVQDRSIGRQLMRDALRRAELQRAAGVRLVQTAYHARSLSLYTKLGFDSREELACFAGTAPGIAIPGREVRSASEADVEVCNNLCRRFHGFDRGNELLDAIHQGTAAVVEHAGRITGYATPLAYFGHAVAETNDDMAALISAAKAYGPGFLVPVRNGDLMRWCLAHGLRVTQVLTLMTFGIYQEPGGVWIPSISY